MIKILLFILMVLFSQNVQAAIAIVSHTCQGSSNSGVSVTTTGINTTGATGIFIFLSNYPLGGRSTPTDSLSNTITALTTHGDGGGNKVETTIYYIANPTTGASQTFTETGQTNFPSLCVIAVSGTTTASPFDVQNGAGSSSATTLATGSVTPSVDNEIVVTGFGFSTSPGTASINGGFTISDQTPDVAGNAIAGAMAYLIQTTATAANPTWTNSGTAFAVSASIATFKASTGGGAIITSSITKGVITNATAY